MFRNFYSGLGFHRNCEWYEALKQGESDLYIAESLQLFAIIVRIHTYPVCPLIVRGKKYVRAIAVPDDINFRRKYQSKV